MTSVEQKHYSQLVGRKITGLVEDDTDGNFHSIPGFKLDNGAVCWILCDPEGNGPGFLEIESQKERRIR